MELAKKLTHYMLQHSTVSMMKDEEFEGMYHMMQST